MIVEVGITAAIFGTLGIIFARQIDKYSAILNKDTNFFMHYSTFWNVVFGALTLIGGLVVAILGLIGVLG